MRRKPIGTGPVQVRRVQDERGHQAHEEHRLLEAGPALSRRHRVHHHRRPFDPHAVLRQRQVRHDLPDRRHGAAAEEHPQAMRRRRNAPCATTGVSTNLIVNRDVPPFDDPQDPARAGADARPPGLHRHPERGRGQDGRRHAAAAGRRVGHAAGDAEDHHRLWRCRQEPRGGARADEAGGLRPRQAAEGQGQHPQHRHLPRSGDHPARPAASTSRSTASSR